MTSIHFVVHPLPGTEDQLNDRYFVVENKRLNQYLSAGYGTYCSGLHFRTTVILSRVCFGIWEILMTLPGLKQGPGILNNPG